MSAERPQGFSRGSQTAVAPASIALANAVSTSSTARSIVEHMKTKRGQRLGVERFDGDPVADTELMPLLLEAGFLAGPRRAVLRP